MATITLYADKLNQMSGLIKDVKKSVADYKSELFSISKKSLQINQSICNLEEVIQSVQASTQTQEEKITSLDKIRQDSEQFKADVIRIDNEVADIINRRKNEFYDTYRYLRPDSERSEWEKFCNGCKKVSEWCKEHWVMVTTVLTVIAIAVVAVATFGVAVAAIAAIAGIASLVLCAADAICMVATGGKSLSMVFRENGWNVLADIFQGLQVGCDIVAIVFPAGAAIKAMAKMGVKTFAKVSFHAVKVSFKETVRTLGKEGFQRSFGTGMKNLGKLTFKTFLFDIDDFTRIKDGKRVMDLMHNPLPMSNPNKNWIVKGEELIPSPSMIPGKYNPEELTMEEIMKQAKFSEFPDTIPYKKSNPDMSVFSVADVDISMKDFDVDNVLNGNLSTKEFSNQLRDMNMGNADKKLLAKTGKTKVDFENACGYKLTWHEDLGMGKCHLVPSEIHANVGHVGAVANYMFNFNKIPDIARLVENKTTQFGFRYAITVSAGLGVED